MEHGSKLSYDRSSLADSEFLAVIFALWTSMLAFAFDKGPKYSIVLCCVCFL